MKKSVMNIENKGEVDIAKTWLVIGALLCMFSVIIGAFAAHGLKSLLSEYQLDIVQTGARYQMYHGLAMLICSIMCISSGQCHSLFKKTNIAFLMGSVLFSGSLYLLALTQIKTFAFLTPVGGLFLIIGWCLFILALLKSPPHIKSNQ
ncbi:MAG: uncharacterized membrane protein YgdD (TMEM256/DUF423 family) [Yoonia sp.]|jgi:uncharacterized membrane protein YgdD (TMEM256/DUF423 family)